MRYWAPKFVRERILRHSLQQIFTRIYDYNAWANADSVSGPGSDLTQTRAVRAGLIELVESLGIETMVDAPCGDYFWMRTTNLNLRRYVGADIVPSMIEDNRKKYGSDNVQFETLDITRDELPRSDLILCRDCLVHLTLKSALGAVRNFKKSGSKYLLTTTYPGLVKVNKQLIITGNWRPLDLTLPPFSFPPPLRLINEECTETGDFKEKSLGLWELASLAI
jgi:hypothetical protein